MRDGVFFHNGSHHLRRPFSIGPQLLTLLSSNLHSGNHTHSLQIGVKLKPPEYHSFLLPLWLKRKDNLRITVGLIEAKWPELEQFYLHRVTNELVSLLNLDDGMIGGHVVENIEKVWVLADLSFDTCLPIGPVLYSLLETALVSWDQGLKIHEIFS